MWGVVLWPMKVMFAVTDWALDRLDTALWDGDDDLDDPLWDEERAS